MFQSTHPRGVRLVFSVLTMLLILFQSTHPRGVRRKVMVIVNFEIGFQSTHPRGVRQDVLAIFGINTKFQSTHPRGVRRKSFHTLDDLDFVSIHAPTRGATAQETSSQAALMFQSTHPRGVRLCKREIPRFLSGFNPRTHEGCDVRK